MAVPGGKEREPLNIPEPITERAEFSKGIVGQKEAVDAFACLLVKIRSGVRPLLSRPIDVKFLIGPSGVGKTEIVYRLAEILAETNTADARSKVLRIDGGEYQGDHQIAKLLGSPPGYIGSKDPRYPNSGIEPQLSQSNLDKHRLFYKDKKGQQNSLTIVLIDEAEKAHPALGKALLSVLDKGELQLGDNSVASFRDTVIFFTANVGSWQVERLREEITNSGRDFPDNFREAAAEALIQDASRDVYKKAFQDGFVPEFRGRVKDLIIFQQLNKEELKEIVAIKIQVLEEEFKASGVDISLKILPEATSWLAGQGYNLSEGARALEKVLDQFIRNPLIAVNSSIHKRTIEVSMKENRLKPEFSLLPSPAEVTVAEQETTETSTEPPTVGSTGNNGQEKPRVSRIPINIQERLLRYSNQDGLPGYIRCRDAYIRKGLLTAEDANSLSGVREAFSRQLVRLGQREGLDGFERFRDALVHFGIGTVEEWNFLLKHIS